MKLQNKATREIREARILNDHFQLWSEETEQWYDYDNFDYLAKWWKRYEEPKGSALDLMILTLINCIENEPDEDMVDLEDCKQMLEKLKAWKRLKGHNLRVEEGQRIFVNADNKLTSQKPLFVVDTYEEVEDDLDSLFCDEDDYMPTNAEINDLTDMGYGG